MIRIDNIAVENYRGIKKDNFKPAINGLIFCGPNGIGKTSRIESIYWTLSGVLMDNSSKGVNEKVKTFKNGKKEPLTIELEITGEFDEKFFISKTLREKWSTKKSSTDEIYEGDEISYTVNGVKKIKKEYDAIVNRIFGIEHIVKESENNKKYEYLKKIDFLNLIINPLYFKRLDKKSQRELLIFAVDDYDVLRIEMSNSCREMLGRLTIDEAKKEIKNDIKALNRDVETNTVKISTLKNDVFGLVCQHCGELVHIDNKIIVDLEHENHDTLKSLMKLESLSVEIETVELEYLRLLDEKVRNTFKDYAHIEIIDDNMNPTVTIMFKDGNNQWSDMENGINTGDGMLRLANFIVYLKHILKIPSSIMFFDSLETLDNKNFGRLTNIDEQIFGTRVDKKLKTLIKELVARSKEEVMVHGIEERD